MGRSIGCPEPFRPRRQALELVGRAQQGWEFELGPTYWSGRLGCPSLMTSISAIVGSQSPGLQMPVPRRIGFRTERVFAKT